MSQQTTCGSRHVTEAVTALLAAHEQLGDEALALAAAETATTADAPLGTIRRMRSGLYDAVGLLAETVELLATVHGNAALGIDGAVSRSAAGTPVSLLPGLRSQQTLLLEAWELVQELADHLDGKVFAATKRSPGLAAAGAPERTSAALLSLRKGVLALGRELDEQGLGDEAGQCRHSAGLLERLEARICPPAVPRPTAEQVVAAIQADPAIAEAAARVLQRAES